MTLHPRLDEGTYPQVVRTQIELHTAFLLSFLAMRSSAPCELVMCCSSFSSAVPLRPQRCPHRRNNKTKYNFITRENVHGCESLLWW